MSVRAARMLVIAAVAATVAALATALAEADPARADASAHASAKKQETQWSAQSRRAARKSVGALSGFDPLVHATAGDVLVSELKDGRKAELTLDPALQSHLTKVLARYEVPYGAVVALEPRTGRVLAYVSHSSANPDAGDLVLDSTPPAASVFKVVTSAALLDAGVPATERVCYGGGLRGIRQADLVDDPRRDKSCVTLSEALGGSVNTVFAKLADRRLEPQTLKRYAEAFGFGQALPFDVPMQRSPAEVPSDRLEFARTAAGFWHVHMSPLHAALMSATIANGGVMPTASMVERVSDAQGKVLYQRSANDFRSVIPASTARVLGRMMEKTIRSGTARSAFFDQQGLPFLPGVNAAGKTGSLSTDSPYRAYSWCVAFAPIEKPRIAVAALVVNTPKWRIKGSYVARETLRKYLIEDATLHRANAKTNVH